MHSYIENDFRSGKESSDSEAEDFEHAEKLRHVKAVLEEVIRCFLLVWLCAFTWPYIAVKHTKFILSKLFNEKRSIPFNCSIWLKFMLISFLRRVVTFPEFIGKCSWNPKNGRKFRRRRMKAKGNVLWRRWWCWSMVVFSPMLAESRCSRFYSVFFYIWQVFLKYWVKAVASHVKWELSGHETDIAGRQARCKLVLHEFERPSSDSNTTMPLFHVSSDDFNSDFRIQ